MTHSVEFIVNMAPYEHVLYKVDGPEFIETFDLSKDLGEQFGDYHASLKAAVLYGRNEATKLATSIAKGIDQAKRGEAIDLGDFSQYLDDDDKIDLITSELGATVIKIETVDLPEEDKMSIETAALKPWQRPVKAATVKPWESGSSTPSKSAQQGMEDF